jgi:DNA-binding beta-propeller fold protein YncE
MRNGSSPLPKNIVREVPRIQIRRWFIVALVILGLIVVGAIGGKAIASGYLSIPGEGTASSQGQLTHSLGRLYILSEIPNPDGSGSSVAGHVTVLNMASKQEIVSIKAGVDVDAVPSADGGRLYIAGADEVANGPGVDHLFAVDTRSGSEIWRVSNSRVKYIGGGPSTLAVSPDGSQLYVYSYPWLELDKYSAGQVPDWIEILDANTGQALPDTVPLPDCGAAGLPTPTVAGTFYVVCNDSKDVRFINTKTFQVEQRVKIPSASGLPGKPDWIVSSIESPSGRKLYVVTSDWRWWT